jgi:hypothetical protein
MPGVWAQSTEGRWQSLPPTGFVSEAELHDLNAQRGWFCRPPRFPTVP